MSDDVTRAQAYRALAEKATPGPWKNVRAAYEDCLVCEVNGTDCLINADKDFIAASSTEGPYFAQKYLDAVAVLEEFSRLDQAITTDDTYGDGVQAARAYVAQRARQFLEGSESE